MLAGTFGAVDQNIYRTLIGEGNQFGIKEKDNGRSLLKILPRNLQGPL